MKTPLQLAIYGGLALCMLNFKAKSQTNHVKATLFEGAVVLSYIDHGAAVNCTGPGLKYTCKPFSLLVGLLPSLKIKEDKSPGNAPKNATIIPSLGCGVTAIYKHIVLQMPMLYTAKTSSKDGKWNVGVGLGYKF
ncbi:hypothetical protein [Pedobacter sp. B4-66]|uniref:hypothetical protein n=1 Tax=Pedobacter sp. B4-66 TaxID=2817280 RepID=UPI00202442FC|nr:hypothetical protein [Pedobacter sp. B4-66]